MPRLRLQLRLRLRQRGAALAVTLALLAIVLLTGISSLRAATVALRLSNALQDADNAFALAARVTAGAINDIGMNPGILPPSGTVTLPPVQEQSARALAAFRYAGAHTCPAPLSGIRHDYELSVTATAGRGAVSHQRSYFYMCRPPCAAAPCAETGPVMTGWLVTRPD